MSRYIDADYVLVEAENIFSDMGDYGWLKRIFENPSTPSIEPKRGEWVDMGDFEQCSVCKGTHLKEFQSYYGKTTWIKTPYCPNCGADMRGADQ